MCLEIVDAVAHEIVVDHLALMLLDQDRQRALVKASYNAEEDKTRFYSEAEARNLALNQSPIGQALETEQPVLLASAKTESDPLLESSGHPVSLLYLPMIARQKTVGVFSLSRPAQQPFGEDDVRILTIIADQAATALANVQLFYELAAANIDLQESERQARQTSLYLESLFEAANDVIFTLDDQGKVTYVNRKVEDWGHHKESLIDRPFYELLADPASESPIAAGLLSKGRQVLEAGLQTASKKRREVLLSTSFIAIEGEHRPAWLVLARDITERKQLEKQLLHSEKLASIGILAAGVAHEIGNPLSAISGYTQILQSGGFAEAEAKEYLEAIESQAGRIQHIIQDLLDYSRPSTGLRSEINLSEAAASIMSMLQTQKTFKKLDIEFDLAEDLPSVHIDRDHLAQVIINIALNAAQAMPEGGRLRISTFSEGDRVRIMLADTGPGIPPDIADRIFDPFFTTKPAGQGTGLGLAICHRIVESYNGTIVLDSKPGRGTTFGVTLPSTAGERT